MNILVYINSSNHLAKSAFEAVTYAKKIGGAITVVATGSVDDATLASLGEYGAEKVLVDRNVSTEDSQQVTRLIAKAAETTGAELIVFSHDLVAKAVAPRLSVRLKAGLISGAVDVPNTANGFVVKVNVFSGKAFGFVSVKSAKKLSPCFRIPSNLKKQVRLVE